MKTLAQKLLVLAVLSLSPMAVAHAGEMTVDQVKSVANSAIALYNASAAPAGKSEERLFEGYVKIDATNCTSEKDKTVCTFDTTETSERDEAVYTPNTLRVLIDNLSHEIKVSLEFGC